MFLTCSMMPSAPFRAAGVPLRAIDKIFDKLGPTPRLCFGTERFLNLHRRSLNEALGRLTPSYLEDISFIREALALDAILSGWIL